MTKTKKTKKTKKKLEPNVYTETHYTKAFRCTNCGYGNTAYSGNKASEIQYVLSIPLGTTIEDFICDEICPRCKCVDVFTLNYGDPLH